MCSLLGQAASGRANLGSKVASVATEAWVGKCPTRLQAVLVSRSISEEAELSTGWGQTVTPRPSQRLSQDAERTSLRLQQVSGPWAKTFLGLELMCLRGCEP